MVRSLEIKAGHALTADDVAPVSQWLSRAVKQAAVEAIG
jgi:hypothetical protein